MVWRGFACFVFVLLLWSCAWGADVEPPNVVVSWRPSKVVNDKIYEIKVKVEAKDDKSPISHAELHFIPEEYEYFITEYGMRPEDYGRVFPPEGERVFVLTPSDGRFDELEEGFSTVIDDIVGGREYRIVVIVEDSAGNKGIAELETPYIRQFENLGKELYEKGIIVAAVYLPFDMSEIPRKDDDPLLGRYDAMDYIVEWKHIDWATGHGINVFLIDSQNHWWPEIKNRVIRVFSNISNTGQVKVAWMMGPSPRHFVYGKYGEEIPEWAIDLSISKNKETFVSFAKELLKPEFVTKESYMKVDGKPVLYIWDEGAFFNQKETYQSIKQFTKEMYGNDLYIIADWIPPIPTSPMDEYVRFLLGKYRGEGLKVVDAFTGWIGFHQVGLDTEQYVKNYNQFYETQLRRWRTFTQICGKNFIVTVVPGFDGSYCWGREPQIPLPRGKERFRERLAIGVKYIDKSIPWIKIDTWNDWGEWSYMEPTVNEGFSYLKVLKETLMNLNDA